MIVGATADMILQPYGAVTAGTIAGTISCLGYKASTEYSSYFIFSNSNDKRLFFGERNILTLLGSGF